MGFYRAFDVTVTDDGCSFDIAKDGRFDLYLVANADPTLEGAVKALGAGSPVTELEELLVEQAPDADNAFVMTTPEVLKIISYSGEVADCGEVSLRRLSMRIDLLNKAEGLTITKVTFRNRYGLTLAADMYIPKNAAGRLPAVAVCGPFGAVKEQASGLYAQTLAERGLIAIAFDPSYTGESGGEPRYVASPDINTEDFCAAVDFLSTSERVDPGRIGILGICGWGGMALNAAAVDTRIRATVASTMYDMSRVTANGYFDAMDADARHELRRRLNAQRTEDYRCGTYARAGGVADPLPADAPQFVKDYHAYYKTPRGYHRRSLNSNEGWNATSSLSFLNMPLLTYAGEIRSAVLLLHGERAHSRYFSEDAFRRLTGDNKELYIVPDANHTDLYDNMERIPFDRIESFFKENLR